MVVVPCDAFIARPRSPATLSHMTTREKVEALIEHVVALPDYAQAEILEWLLDMRAQQLGICHLDEDEREALAAS